MLSIRTFNGGHQEPFKRDGSCMEGVVRSMEMTKRNMHSVRIFYSYAHKDKTLRDRLALDLGEKHISGWYDRDISPGTDWEHEIDANLEIADIVLLLISDS